MFRHPFIFRYPCLPFYAMRFMAMLRVSKEIECGTKSVSELKVFLKILKFILENR